jgi:glycogen debranching enzyme
MVVMQAIPMHARRPRDGAPPRGPTGADVDPIRPASSIAASGYTVLVCGPDGAIERPEHGLFDFDTRILSRHVLKLGGKRPRYVGACVADAGRWSSTLVVGQDGGTPEGPRLPQDALAVHVERAAGCGMSETITVRNESMVEVTTRLELELDADIVDVLRTPTGTPAPDVTTTWDPATTTLSIVGAHRHADRIDRRGVAVTVEPPPTAVRPVPGRPTARRFVHRLAIAPGGAAEISLVYASLVDGAWRTPADAAGRDALREDWRAQRTRIETGEALVGPAAERAADDLLTLRNWELEPSPDGSAWVVNAGLPSFTGYFGRDTLTAAFQAAMLGPEPIRGALEIAARTQGQIADPWSESEPGRMVHEMRRGPLSMLDIRPHRAYYGSQTTGSMFVLALSELWHWTGDDDILLRHRGAALDAVDWAENLGDRDGDGFLEYHRRNPDGLKNQGWKDSDEAIRYPDGRIVENPISPIEEQAFHYMALQRMAEILIALGDHPGRPAELLKRASRLRRSWHDTFWLPDAGYYAIALDSERQPVRTIASNAGHALGVGIVPAEVAPMVADRLLAADLFSGWGVRTLSSEHPSYNPFAYHLGAVWPVENATVALGFKRYGLDDHLDQLAEGFFAAVAECRDLRLPEALTGHDRAAIPAPLPYPGSTSPQAWSSSAVIQFVQVLLGLYPFAPAGVLGLVRPRLPTWLPTITLHGLRVGRATVTLRFERRADGSARHTVVAQDGPLRIVELPPPNAVAGDDGVVPRLLGWALDHAPGRRAAAMRIAIGADDALGGDPERNGRR